MEYTDSSYTQEDREEVKKILQQYNPPKDSLIDQIKVLDEKAKRQGLIVSIVIGVVGSLTLGSGMCLVLLTDILPWGIITGVIGMLIMGLAFPVYLSFLKKGKAKYGEEIRKLSEELLNQ